MQREDAAFTICRFARPGLTFCSTEERREAQRLCELSKSFLRSRIETTCLRHISTQPFVRWYSSDATPLLMHKTFSILLAGLRRITRTGKDSVDYLCERLVYSGVDAAGDPVRTMYAPDPTPLTRGKTGWDMMACQMIHPLPRSLGVTGPVIHHYTWDRGAYSILDRLTRQHHQYEQDCNQAADDSKPVHRGGITGGAPWGGGGGYRLPPTKLP